MPLVMAGSLDLGSSRFLDAHIVRDRPTLDTLLQLRDDTAQPLYQQIEGQLRALISDGTLTPGTTLPAERQLAESLGISRTTVKRCYDRLRDSALIDAHGRLGFIVKASAARLNPGMNRLKGFTEEMRELGKTPSSLILHCAVEPDRAVASIFGVPTTARLLKLDRVRLGDNIPLSHELAWYNLTVAPALAQADLSGSIYACLRGLGVSLTHCEQSIEATTPTPEECAIFDFDLPVPCLLIKRRTFDEQGRLIEYVEGLFRGDQYSYRMRLNI
jgi:GntR family transcriptional regulator